MKIESRKIKLNSIVLNLDSIFICVFQIFNFNFHFPFCIKSKIADGDAFNANVGSVFSLGRNSSKMVKRKDKPVDENPISQNETMGV